MTSSKLRALLAVLIAAIAAAGCGSNDAEGVTEDDVGETQQAIAPSGSNAQVVSHTIPSSMFPGERRIVTVTMRNTGAAAPANNWTTSGPAYALRAINPNFRVAYTYVPSTVAVGSTVTLGFIITAPFGNDTFTARMAAVGLGDFGELLSVPVTVSSGVTPQYGCTYESGVPTTMAPNENRVITVVVRNTGFATWPANDVRLAAKDNPVNFWNNTISNGVAAVAPGATASFSFAIRAPASAGTYSFTRDARYLNNIGDFRAVGFCIERSITVGGTPPLNAAVVSNNFPATMAGGEVRPISVVMQNTGSETWLNNGTYMLYSTSSPTNLWGVTQSVVGTATVQGANATFNFNITAPTTPGSYTHSWQMRKTSGTNAGFFGAAISIPVTVTAAAPPYFATVVSQTIPTRVTAGEPTTFQIVMRNTGTQPWTGNPFMLYSTNTPVALWNLLLQSLGASETVNAGQTRTFTLNVTAPGTPGTYSSSWRMRQAPGINYFGNTALTSNIVVTLCGNGVVDAGEQCDDDNLVSGDDCSDTCQFEQVVIGPNVTAGRNIYGTGPGAQVGPVVIGDVTGDGVLDVLTSQRTGAAGTGTNKGQAGSVYGFTSAPFMNGTSTIAPTSNFVIGGAEGGDLTGSNDGGRIVLGNLVGSATLDIVVSSRVAAGPANGRPGAGEAYVITGGSLAGTINLGLTPFPSSVGAHITGQTGDLLQALAVGNLTGSAAPDLLLGAPGRSGGVGALIILPGPLSGEIDLLAPPAGTITIVGALPTENIGYRAAIGDLNNDGILDILAGAQNSNRSGRVNSGAAYLAYGPFTSDVNFALPAGTAGGPAVIWLGQSDNDRLGSALAIGNVTGDATNEALITAIQMRKTPAVPTSQFGAVTVWSGATGQNDLASVTAPLTIFGVDQYDDCGNTVGTARITGGAYDDIVLGCGASEGATNNVDRAGEIHVVRGRATFPVTVWDLAVRPSQLVIYGTTWGGYLGRGLQTLAFADFDADGFADICGGSYNGQTANVVAGRVDCYLSPF